MRTIELTPALLTPDVLDRFDAKRIKGAEDECWPWMGARNRALGHGRLSIKGRLYFAHRIAIVRHLGMAIPPQTYVCHRCDNPPCCNPAHLFLGTSSENTHDCKLKGRHKGYKAITAELALKLRRSREPSERLGRRFGISGRMVRYIRTGRCWREAIRRFKASRLP